jgi:hypothetical protein
MMEMQYFVAVVAREDENKNNSTGQHRENSWSTSCSPFYSSVQAYET